MAFSKIPVHCSVVTKENFGIVLIGKRNSAKTSISYCLIENGWKLLTDSTCLISQDAEMFVVQSTGKSNILYFKYPTIFPELNNHEYGIEEFSPKHNELRLIFDINLMFKSRFEEKSEIKLFIFPQLTDQKKSQLFELSAAEALSIFMQDAWNLNHENYDFNGSDEDFIKNMFSQIRCLRMNIGKDWRYFMDELFELDAMFKTETLLK